MDCLFSFLRLICLQTEFFLFFDWHFCILEIYFSGIFARMHDFKALMHNCCRINPADFPWRGIQSEMTAKKESTKAFNFQTRKLPQQKGRKCRSH